MNYVYIHHKHKCFQWKQHLKGSCFLWRYENQYPVNGISFGCSVNLLNLSEVSVLPSQVPFPTAHATELHYCSITEINYAENSHFPHFCHHKAWGVTCQTDERNMGIQRAWKRSIRACLCQSCLHIVGCTQMLSSTSQLCRPERKRERKCPAGWVTWGYLFLKSLSTVAWTSLKMCP